MSHADQVEIEKLLDRSEGTRLEFKAAVNSYSVDKAIQYCAALANEGGGRLVLGITDDVPRKVVGSDALRNPAEVEQRIHEKIRIGVAIRELHYDSKRVVILQIPPRRIGTPIDCDGRFLKRAGESLVSMTAHEIAQIFDETRLPPGSDVVLSNQDAAQVTRLLDIDTYFRLLPDSRPGDLNDQLACLVNRELLRVEAEGRYGITAQGALFLAQHLEDFPTLRHRRVRFLRYAGPNRANATFEHFESRGYGVGFEELISLITGMTPVREEFAGGLRRTIPVYPPTAVREFLANALIHQDLREDSVQITVELFSDRLEIRNPGEPLIDPKRFVDETRTRNVTLAEIMRLAQICEVRGSGVDRAVEQIEHYLQPAPTFRSETAATTITLFEHMEFTDMTQEERIWSAFLHCCLRYESSARLTNTSLRERFGVDQSKVYLVSQTIAASIEVGFIKLDPRVGRSRRHAAYVPFFA